jgi:hypothetical protein
VESVPGISSSSSATIELTRTAPHDPTPSSQLQPRRRSSIVNIAGRARSSRSKTLSSQSNEPVPPVPRIGLGIVGLHFEPSTGKYTFRGENNNSRSEEKEERQGLKSSSPMERGRETSSASSSGGSRFSSASSAFASSEGEDSSIASSATFQVSASSHTTSKIRCDQEEVYDVSDEILGVLFGTAEKNDMRTS